MIYGLFNNINSLRASRGVPQLLLNTLGMKDAEMRAVQFAAYMAAHTPGSPGFWPHEGWDTTAAALGYNIVTENLAYITQDPSWIVYSVWQDALHLGAMLTTQANVTGVSCIYSDGTAYWTYEPGSCTGNACGSTPPPDGPTLDGEQWAFLSLINAYRAQNGARPLQVSVALQNAAQWMSADMAANNYASHIDSLGRGPGARLAAFGYAYSPWGENIAGGFSDAQGVFDGWKGACDPDASGNCTYAHRLNMLNPSFAAIGIGRVYQGGSRYGWYWTTDFGGYLDQAVPPGPGPSAPVISSFAASPTTIVQGQSTQLSWSVTGAATLAIDQGVGDVTGKTSIAVSPPQTRTYRLTATNSAGSTTATVTVTVNSIAGDTQPPTQPVITSASAPSAARVELAWMGSTDNVGVTRYRVLRNGTAVASLGPSSRSWSDTTVAASVTYSYVVKAFDAAGNSAASAAAQVTTPAIPGAQTCPGPAANSFTGCYYNNIMLAGAPVLTRVDPIINFNWGSAAPSATLTPYNFSVRWQGNFPFNQGMYSFTITASDGVRVSIDGEMILDRWRDQAATTYTLRRFMNSGSHLVTVDYYERTGTSLVQFSWKSDSPPQAPQVISFTATPAVIAPGQTATLAWSVSNAASVSIDPGLGAAPASGSRSVTPSKTTTYTLTASNGAGSASASTTVTVSAPASDTQPPTVPVVKSVTARNATTVDLSWTASQDNVGVAGYQVLRNSAAMAAAPGGATSWTDATAKPSTAYTYALKAFDAAGNYSDASVAAQVTTPPDSGAGGCSAGAGVFAGCYYNNIDLFGNPVLTATDSRINFSWQTGFPNAAVSLAGFSVRWQGNFDFQAGALTFRVLTSDGIRLYVDGELIIDRWRDQPPYTYTATRTLAAGSHAIVLEYYCRTGSPVIQLTWQ